MDASEIGHRFNIYPRNKGYTCRQCGELVIDKFNHICKKTLKEAKMADGTCIGCNELKELGLSVKVEGRVGNYSFQVCSANCAKKVIIELNQEECKP